MVEKGRVRVNNIILLVVKFLGHTNKSCFTLGGSRPPEEFSGNAVEKKAACRIINALFILRFVVNLQNFCFCCNANYRKISMQSRLVF